MGTKIAVSATVKLHDVHIEVAVSLQRKGPSSQYRANGAAIAEFIKTFLPTYTTFPRAQSHAYFCRAF